MNSLLSLIEQKRDGKTLSQKDFDFFTKSIISKKPPPEYQTSALLAFIFCKGLSNEEISALTLSMKNSGDCFSYKGFPKGAIYVDKHSTGGVGDKVSIPLGPLVTACSEKIHIPMIAGRGLGHSGGTVDKLESIPGFNTSQTPAQFYKTLKKHRLCFTGQTAKIAPADRVLYSLRDVTGTVPSIPLITASILSKKLSENLDFIVFDVKVGSGAFMKTSAEAKALAESLVRVAQSQNVTAKALLTKMDSPLGHYSGNLLEIKESFDILKDIGPDDSTLLSIKLAHEMIAQENPQISEEDVVEKIKSGEAFQNLERIIEAQGGKLSALENEFKKINKLKVKVLQAPKTGFLDFDVYQLGMALVELGAGRKTKEDKIDPYVGFYHPLDHGSKVEKGQELLKIYYRSENSLTNCLARLKKAVHVLETTPNSKRLIEKTIQ